MPSAEQRHNYLFTIVGLLDLFLVMKINDKVDGRELLSLSYAIIGLVYQYSTNIYVSNLLEDNAAFMAD